VTSTTLDLTIVALFYHVSVQHIIHYYILISYAQHTLDQRILIVDVPEKYPFKLKIISLHPSFNHIGIDKVFI
jgi:hypothetical protein